KPVVLQELHRQLYHKHVAIRCSSVLTITSSRQYPERHLAARQHLLTTSRPANTVGTFRRNVRISVHPRKNLQNYHGELYRAVSPTHSDKTQHVTLLLYRIHCL